MTDDAGIQTVVTIHNKKVKDILNRNDRELSKRQKVTGTYTHDPSHVFYPHSEGYI